MYGVEFSLGCGVSVEMSKDGSLKIKTTGFEGATIHVSKETSRALASMLMSMIKERDLQSRFEDGE